MLAAIGYLPILFLVPLMARRDDPFCRFHGVQSLVLFGALLLLWISINIMDFLFGRIMGSLFLIGFIFKLIAWIIHNIGGPVVSLAYIALVIAGIVQAAAGQYWRVPFLGRYVERLHT
ncbi:MAG: hypothetical protein ABIK44_03170 [candidate division WOR-3 bacterium]